MLGDTLMCSYHGWQFTEGGKCVDVPQAEGTRGNERACASPRSCVASFPTTVRPLQQHLPQMHLYFSDFWEPDAH